MRTVQQAYEVSTEKENLADTELPESNKCLLR